MSIYIILSLPYLRQELLRYHFVQQYITMDKVNLMCLTVACGIFRGRCPVPTIDSLRIASHFLLPVLKVVYLFLSPFCTTHCKGWNEIDMGIGRLPRSCAD